MVAPVVAAAVARGGAAAGTGARAAAGGAARTGAGATRAPAATAPRTAPRSEPGIREGEERAPRQQPSARQRQQTYEEQERQRRADKEAIRIDNLMVITMMTVAIVCDAAQFVLNFFHVIPVVGNAIAFIITGYIGVVASWIIFPLWFKLRHVEFMRGKQAVAKIGALAIPAVTEFVTFLNAVPAIILGVGITIIITRMEDVFGEDLGESANALMKAKTPAERSRMQLEMGRAFVAGRRYRPEEPGQAPGQQPAKNAPAPGRAFDIANPAVYDYQNPGQATGGGGQASAMAAPFLALGRFSTGGKESFAYREMRRAATKIDDQQSGRESWAEGVSAGFTPWDTRTKGEKTAAKAAAVKRRQDAIEATS